MRTCKRADDRLLLQAGAFKAAGQQQGQAGAFLRPDARRADSLGQAPGAPRQDPQIARDAQGQPGGLARMMGAHRSPAPPPRVG